jgi:uncharacterized protein with von Willebrand factor type A (vWA) domain
MGTKTGIDGRVSVDERLAFAKLYTQNPYFKRFLGQIGRMSHIANQAQKTKSKHMFNEFNTIQYSQDVAHILPIEYIYLSNPELELIFDQKYIAHQLASYEFHGKKKLQKGPMVVCIDVSGSMEGNLDLAAKGIGIALVQIALKDKRNTHILLFDSKIRREFDFIAGKAESWQRLADMASYFSGGGTSFSEPIQKAIDLFTTDQRYEQADLVVITDGNGHLNSEIQADFLTLKRDRGIKTYALVIGSEYQADTHVLKPISDTLIAVESLNEAAVSHLFDTV